MAEGEMTPGEIARNFARLDKSLEAMQSRQTELARESVSAAAFTAALAQIRTDWVDDHAHDSVLAAERHNALLDRIGQLDRATGRRLANLEQVNSSRPMNAWTKASIILVAVFGLMGLAVTFYVGTHH
jgi:hypothetical protein